MNNVKVPARLNLDGELTRDEVLAKFDQSAGVFGAEFNHLRDSFARQFDREVNKQAAWRDVEEEGVDWSQPLVEAGDTWACEPLIRQDRGGYLCADDDTGKSLLALEASVRMADGKPFLLKPETEPRRVIYLDFERDRGTMLKRLQLMNVDWLNGETKNLKYMDCFDLARKPRLHTQDGADWVLAQAGAFGAEVVIIDSYARSCGGDQLNSTETPVRFYDQTVMGLLGEGMSVLWLSHTPWNANRPGGNRQQQAVAGYGVVMNRAVSNKNRLTLEVRKDNEGQATAPTYFVERQDGPLRHVIGDGLTEKQRECVVTIRATNRKDWSVTSAVEATGTSKKVVEAALAHLRLTGEIDPPRRRPKAAGGR